MTKEVIPPQADNPCLQMKDTELGMRSILLSCWPKGTHAVNLLANPKSLMVRSYH